MLKISLAGKTARGTTLKLEGRVIGPWVDELRQICELSLSEGNQLNLDLSGVSFVDDVGVNLLGGYRSRGVALTGCSPFVEEQLKSTAHARR